jgi:hypothetical protein
LREKVEKYEFIYDVAPGEARKENEHFNIVPARGVGTFRYLSIINRSKMRDRLQTKRDCRAY